MSLIMVCSVLAEMLTVPAQAACSCEQEMVSGGRCRSGYAALTAVAIVAATTVSVASGRKAFRPGCEAARVPSGRFPRIR
jgi:hypothetical protein